MTTINSLLSSTGHTKVVVVDDNQISLNTVVSSIKHQYSNAHVKGYSDYKTFLKDINIAKAKQVPFMVVLIRQRDIQTKYLLEIAKQLGSMVFSYEAPDRLCPQIGSNFCLIRQYL